MIPDSGSDPPVPPEPPGRPQGRPYVARCAPGKYAWCRCQKSARYPYCDGTHRGTAVTPLKVVLDQEQVVSWCACGRSGNAPFCDGTHGRMGPVPAARE